MQKTHPQVKWDGKTFFVTLPVENGRTIKAKWEPGHTYVVRLRESGTDGWSFGFETPMNGFTFVDLKPGTEYEVQIRTKTAAGEGDPTHATIRTNPTGNTGNVIPFPKR